MKQKIFTLVFACTLVHAAMGQQQSDTVVVSLGKTSKVIFTMQDRSDLDILKHYNFQDLFQDILTRLEKSDTSVRNTPVAESEPETDEQTTTDEKTAEEEKEENWNSSGSRETNDDDDDDYSFSQSLTLPSR